MTIPTNNIKAVILDLDGTLIHLPIDWPQLKQELIQSRLLLKHQSLTNAINSTKSKTNKQKLNNLLSVIGRYEALATDCFRLNQSLYEWIQANRNKYILSICSSNLHATVEAVLNKIGIHQYFHQILGNEDVNQLKPDPEGINKILTRLHLNATETVFIGDQPSDLIAAAKAGINFLYSHQLTNHLRPQPYHCLKPASSIQATTAFQPKQSEPLNTGCKKVIAKKPSPRKQDPRQY